VILMEAIKQTFAVRPKGRAARVPVQVLPGFAPAPVGRKTRHPLDRQAITSIRGEPIP
jgi:hypothetical protein